MIEHQLDKDASILVVRPKSALAAADFAQLAEAVDPFIARSGGLAGVLIEAPAFPGWESFGALVAHFKFVKDHHKRIKRLAVVTDSALGEVVERLAAHFVSAQIRHFAGGETAVARRWLLGKDVNAG